MTLLGREHGYLEVIPHNAAERRADREVILLLHGLGGNKSDWSFPKWRSYHWDHLSRPERRESDNHLTPPLNPLDYINNFSISDHRDDVRCWTGLLSALGHTVVNYSQDGPGDEVQVPLAQLESLVVPFIRDQILVGPLANKRLILLCHSRGGILARAFIAQNLQEAEELISRVITLCSPHQGSLAPLAKQRLLDAASVLASPVTNGMSLALAALSRITGFLTEGEGANQLIPNNAIFDELAQPGDISSIEFETYGGTSVRYFRVYYWVYTPDSYVPGGFPDIRFDWTLVPIEIPLISPMMDQLPDFVVDDEQDNDEGDGLVSNERARLVGAPHRTMRLNHVEALYDEQLFTRVARSLGTPVPVGLTFECTSTLIGNQRSKELHDPSRQTRNCQLGEIVEPWPFTREQDAFDEGYDGCAYCMPEHHTR